MYDRTERLHERIHRRPVRRMLDHQVAHGQPPTLIRQHLIVV